MTLIGGIVIYILLWWLVLFCVLPWGNKAADKVAPGHAPSAPANPRLGRKFLATTGIALILFLVVWAVMESGQITLRR